MSGLFISNLDDESGIEYFKELTEREAQLKLLGYCITDHTLNITISDNLIEMAKHVKLSLCSLYDLLWHADAMDLQMTLLTYAKLIGEAKKDLVNNQDTLFMYTPASGGTIYCLMDVCTQIEQFILEHYYTNAFYKIYAGKEN
ncbi:MAG: hypothetical protein J6V44_12460 [Methanobrevibacter sp.]|nr:hypothetical protein [Methanobrevibacter sp.]